ncbi:MAG: AEC family transporter [Pseudomonadota bacterium]
MLNILSIVAPVFLLIGAGYAATRAGRFPDAGIDGLIAFVVRFATPSLLFLSMYRVDLGAAFQPLMLVSFYAGAFACFFIGRAVALRLGRRPGEAVSLGFAALFSNTVLVGLPIMFRAYGEEATQPAFAIIALHAPSLYTFGMVMMEMSRQGGEGAVAALKRAGRSVSSNALMIGIFLGLLANLTGLPLPGPVEDTLEMLASATLPAALFALGAALTRYKLQAEIGWAAGLSALGLIVHPLIAWILSDLVFGLEREFVNAAVVIAAMPAGLNVYVFATLYKRAEPAAAGVVLMSTALSVITISVWLAVLG